MELEVTTRERNELLEREDIELSLDHTGEETPSENAVRSKLAAELDLDPKTIQVDHVYTATGSGTSRAEVTVFDEPVLDDLPEEEPEDEEADNAEAEEDAAEEAEDAEADGEEDESEETEEAEEDEGEE